MAVSPDTLQDFVDHAFDTVIDVRSPSEFAEDHVPGAINLPVLDDAERARVGTIYKQDSPFRARKLGAALVFRNASRHIEDHLTQFDGGWRPLVYCWRGGQRSGAFGWMLKEIGWRADVLDGGYRRFRRLVHAAMYTQPLQHRLVLLDGQTGTAKTELLKRVASLGGQVLDLEGAARHRGSLLGDGPEPQPSQKAFESTVALALARCDPSRPVLVEDESSKIGRLNLPPSLWTAMQTAERLEVHAPVAERVAFLEVAYRDILADDQKLRSRLHHLRSIRGHAIVDRWMQMIEASEKRLLTESLVRDHYDPAYDTARKRRDQRTARRLKLDRLNAAALDRAADELAKMLGDLVCSV